MGSNGKWVNSDDIGRMLLTDFDIFNIIFAHLKTGFCGPPKFQQEILLYQEYSKPCS
jgi:hypothetical protein